MTLLEAAKQAREALEDRASLMKWQKAREALDKAIAKAEQQKPVAEITVKNGHWIDTTGFVVRSLKDGLHKLYIHPQAREPLTDEQCEDAIRTSGLWPLACVTPQNKALLIGLCRAAHGIKGDA